MALKITTQIGTDNGIINEAYIRIYEYSISKYGFANFKYHIFPSEEKAPIIDLKSNYIDPVIYLGVRNQQIGNLLNVDLKKTINKDVIIDFQEITSYTIFEFGYLKLKEKLSAIFGLENIIDC